MKKFVVLALLLLLAGVDLSSAAWDYLQPPVDLPEQAEYRKFLTEKLDLTPFDCGRVIIEPPYGYGENSLSVYSSNGGYRVTYVEAADSLRDWTNGGSDLEKGKNVKILRFDAEIPQTAATLIKQIWIGVLSDVRPIPKSAAPGYVWGDATIATFSIPNDVRQVTKGEALLVSDNGKKVRELIRLTERLQQYCKAEAATRPAISKRIEQEAAALLAELKAK